MGKTNPSYRDKINHFEKEWQPFRRALRRHHQEYFDELLVQARNHADAGHYQNPVEPKWGVLVSICLAQQRELAALKERVEALEN
jgi:hypothetical protein